MQTVERTYVPGIVPGPDVLYEGRCAAIFIDRFPNLTQELIVAMTWRPEAPDGRMTGGRQEYLRLRPEPGQVINTVDPLTGMPADVLITSAAANLVPLLVSHSIRLFIFEEQASGGVKTAQEHVSLLPVVRDERIPNGATYTPIITADFVAWRSGTPFMFYQWSAAPGTWYAWLHCMDLSGLGTYYGVDGTAITAPAPPAASTQGMTFFSQASATRSVKPYVVAGLTYRLAVQHSNVNVINLSVDMGITPHFTGR